MLIAASILLVGVSLMHSVLGGRRLIAPICELDKLPIILGSRRNSVLTLTIGWHLLSVFWVFLAAMLMYIHFQVPSFQSAFVTCLGLLSILCGLGAFVLSRANTCLGCSLSPSGVSCLLPRSRGDPRFGHHSTEEERKSH